MRERVTRALTSAYTIVRAAVHASGEHAVSMMAASMAFWLLVALAPFVYLLSVIGSAVSRVGDYDTTLAEMVSVLTGEMAVREVVSGGWSSVVFLLIVIYSASAFFTQFAYALQRIWGTNGRGAIWSYARRHLFGFLLVAVLGVALFVSAIAGNLLVFAVGQLRALAEAAGLETTGVTAVLLGRFAVDMIASALLFLVAFAFVPDRRINVRDVIPGAVLTGLAFAIGQVALSYYLSATSRVTLAGSLGSLIALLLWVYYTSLMSLGGAELTREIVEHRERTREQGAEQA